MRLAIPLLAIVLCGCAIPPPLAESPMFDRTFPTPYNETWSALMTVLTDKSLPIQAIEKESGIVKTEFVRVENGFGASTALLERANANCTLCGINAVRECYSVHAVARDSANTRVQIRLHIEGWTEGPFMMSGWAEYPSNGREEQTLLNDVAENLGVPKQPVEVIPPPRPQPPQPPPAASRDSTGKYVPPQLYGR